MRLILCFLSILMLSHSSPLQAAGRESPFGASKSQEYNEAEKLIRKGEYNAAIPLLQKSLANDPDDADTENYLGYSYRKTGDFEKALTHYQKALALEDDHLGANEYLGELYLQMGQLEKAEERLEVLDDACFFGCEEYDELKEAIAEYKAKQGS